MAFTMQRGKVHVNHQEPQIKSGPNLSCSILSQSEEANEKLGARKIIDDAKKIELSRFPDDRSLSLAVFTSSP